MARKRHRLRSQSQQDIQFEPVLEGGRRRRTDLRQRSNNGIQVRRDPRLGNDHRFRPIGAMPSPALGYIPVEQRPQLVGAQLGIAIARLARRLQFFYRWPVHTAQDACLLRRFCVHFLLLPSFFLVDVGPSLGCVAYDTNGDGSAAFCIGASVGQIRVVLSVRLVRSGADRGCYFSHRVRRRRGLGADSIPSSVRSERLLVRPA